jgi:hypothetical protein
MDAKELRAYAAFYSDIQRRLGDRPEAAEARQMSDRYMQRAHDEEARQRNIALADAKPTGLP